MLTHVSLFTGIGGIDLAAEWAGFKTICFVEIDDYCQKVLNKHWPDVPVIGDIRDVTKETIANSSGNNGERNSPEVQGEEQTGMGCDTYRSRDYRTIPPVTLITGGFPCQPVSQAGKRKGKDDDRWLWPEMLRVISEIRPAWVVAENVAGLLNMGFNDCVSDLESQGYETQSFLIPACAVNAPHRRDRIFIVAHAKRSGQQAGESRSIQGISGRGKNDSGQTTESSNVADTETRTIWTGLCENGQTRKRGRRLGNGGGSDASHSEGQGLEGSDTERDSRTEGRSSEYGQGGWNPDWWATEPQLGRVAYGIPHRVDRLRCLGNAVVPQQIYPILKAIADIERGRVV